MSGHHFHVHGPHDHAVEHGGHGGDRFAAGIAVMTAILATLGALFGYQGGATQNAAMLHKNEAAIKKTEASNQWNYYQAKSNKQNLAELAVALTAASDKQRFLDEVERYKKEKAEIKAAAEKLEADSSASDAASEHSLHEHHRWAQAMTLMQVAISLAAITLLTRRKWLFWTSIGTAAGGVAVAALALMHM
ncbi:MAG: DUF4337 domain-containing protein [Rhodocyclaceae bacterium]|nr:DUF4337 domain-containing protein [Rhodocyclaceae bacterium]MBX3668185.1 DUF4337 domain-containing protein [Rhodocyclaceae bacterium]